MRIRNFAITIFGAFFGAVGLSLSRDVDVEVGSISFPLGLVLLVVALLTWASFWFMDRHWYHRLLYGAVRQGMIVEGSIRSAIPEIALTERIGEESPLRLWGIRIRSPQKIDLFYGAGGLAIVIAIVALLATVIFSSSSQPVAAKGSSQGEQAVVISHGQNQRGSGEGTQRSDLVARARAAYR
jgi:hypothetical protein